MRTAPSLKSRMLVSPFLGWTLIGASACFTVLSGLSVGIYVTPVLLGALFVMLRWARGRTLAAAGLIPGPGLVLLYVAYLNRRGPGNVCTTNATTQQCVTELSPWPWLIAGIAVLAVGIAAFGLLLSRRAKSCPFPG